MNESMSAGKKILLYGYGNPGRQDDGLGDALVQRVSEWILSQGIDGVDCDSNFQLQVEDAATIKQYDEVFFVDASMDEQVESFSITPLEADGQTSFTMHSVSPGFILFLCEKLFESCPKAWLVQIRGYSWEMEEELSPGARHNLLLACKEVQHLLSHPEERPA